MMAAQRYGVGLNRGGGDHRVIEKPGDPPTLADQHYLTLAYDEIKAFAINGKPVREIAHKEAVLLMWCTAA
jgi:hypothetical protein